MSSLLLPILLLFPAPQEEMLKKTEPKSFQTEHVGTFNGRKLAYTATVAENILKNRGGEPQASIFTIAYVQKDIEDPATRPVTFLWNGGPGSSSVWLHMGVFGPVRVDVPSDARDDGAPPFGVIDNPGCILDVTDIVFIDPVGTGFSTTLGDAEGKDFFGVHQDARSVAKVIRQWISENKRWNSPKLIGGESYGTTRSAAVVRELEGNFDDVSINGILLISTILDFSVVSTSTGNELPHLIHLPTMAATAWYHGKAGQCTPLREHVERARRFALSDYSSALLRGASLGDEERGRIRAELAHLTGLDEGYIDRSDLRLHPGRFQKELLRDRGLTVGRLDSRYTGEDLDDAGETPETDPSFYGIDGAYTAALNTYLRDTLGVDVDGQYSIIGGLWDRWDWDIAGVGRPTYLNVAPYIGKAMRQNKDLHVLVACGYYDFATPFFGAEYSLNRSGVVPERLRFTYYEAGHMMYVNHTALAALQADVRTLILDILGHDG